MSLTPGMQSYGPLKKPLSATQLVACGTQNSPFTQNRASAWCTFLHILHYSCHCLC